MKYNIFGFSQAKLVEYKLNLDHAAILRWFVDFYPSDSMVKILVDGKQFGWVRYDAVLQELPCMQIKTKDRIYRLFNDLVVTGVLDKYTLRKGGTFSYFSVGSMYLNLITDGKKTEPSVNITEGYGENNGTGYGEKTVTNNPSSNYNPSTKSSYSDSEKSQQPKPKKESIEDLKKIPESQLTRDQLIKVKADKLANWSYEKAKENHRLPVGDTALKKFYFSNEKLATNWIKEYIDDLGKIAKIIDYCETDEYWRDNYKNLNNFNTMRTQLQEKAFKESK